MEKNESSLLFPDWLLDVRRKLLNYATTSYCYHYYYYHYHYYYNYIISVIIIIINYIIYISSSSQQCITVKVGTVSENLAVEQETVENHSLIIYLRGPHKWFKVLRPILYTLAQPFLTQQKKQQKFQICNHIVYCRHGAAKLLNYSFFNYQSTITITITIITIILFPSLSSLLFISFTYHHYHYYYCCYH